MAGPCGVQELSWPYACDIDDANGLLFDPLTGRLWVKPDAPTYVYEDAAIFTAVPGAAEVAAGDSSLPLRIWWAGLWPLAGALPQQLSTEASITHTNTTCYPQFVRAQVSMPEVRWNMSWSAARCYIGMLGFYNSGSGDVQTGVTATSSHDALTDSANWSGSSPGPFGDPYPSLQAKANTAGTSVAASVNMKSAAHLVDLWNGWTLIAPGETATLKANLFCRADQARPADGNWLGYFQSYADVIATIPMWLTAQVVSVQ